ncbi:EamA family transporter, partial [Vibrio cincinnatiensis]
YRALSSINGKSFIASSLVNRIAMIDSLVSLKLVVIRLHFNFNSQYSTKLPTMLLTTLQLLMAGCLGLLLSACFEVWPQTISSTTWKWFTLSVLLATSLRYLMQTMGQKNAPPSNAALLMLLEPVWTLLFSIWIYQETLPFNKVVGCALLLGSLLLYRMPWARRS